MYDQLNEFFKKSTTISSRFEEAKTLKVPTITFCISNALKNSVMKKYKFKSSHDILYSHKNVLNKTMDELYEEASYILNRDFRILASYDFWFTNTTLVLGSNTFIFGIKFNLEAIKTITHGTCYKLNSDFEITFAPLRIEFHIIPTEIINKYERASTQKSERGMNAVVERSL